MAPRLLILATLLALVLSAGAARAAEPSELNVDCAFGWQGLYRSAAWTPVEVTIANALTEPFEGELVFVSQQDLLTETQVRLPLALTPGVLQKIPLVTKFAAGGRDCRLTIVDSHGRVRWQHVYDPVDYSPYTQTARPLEDEDLLVVVAGRRRIFGLDKLPEAAHSSWNKARDKSSVAAAAHEDMRPGAVYVREMSLEHLPWEWAAYAGVDLLVLYDPDWEALAPAQSAAMAQWVEGGGRLLVVLGSRPLAPKHAVAGLLPWAIGPAEEVTLPRAALAAWGCEKVEKDAVVCWSLEGAVPAGWTVETFDAHHARRLFASGLVGFGRVAVLPFDPAALGEGEHSAFWFGRLNALLDVRQIKAGQAESNSNSSYYNYSSDICLGDTAVMDHLLDIPQMQPIGIGWIILLLVGLAVVIGPLDYLVLRKLDRLPLTWLTFGTTLLVFSALAYWGVGALRGGACQLRAVTVLDGVAGRPGGWLCTYSGIFAPHSGDYELTGLRPKQWWSPTSPPVPYYTGERAMASRQMVVRQENGHNHPAYLPIDIWSMQCLETEERAEKLPLVAAVKVEVDRVRASVTNLAAEPVAGGYILLSGNRMVRFGPIAAGQSLEIDEWVVAGPGSSWDNTLKPLRDNYGGWYFGASPAGRFEPDTVLFASGNLPRTRAAEAWLERGAAVVCARYDKAAEPYGLKGRSYEVVHTKIVRLVVPAVTVPTATVPAVAVPSSSVPATAPAATDKEGSNHD